jgi:serine protease inhibitor
VFTRQANLHKISQQPLFVSEVVQKAQIEVDEEGATAAAATGIDCSLSYLEFLYQANSEGMST